MKTILLICGFLLLLLQSRCFYAQDSLLGDWSARIPINKNNGFLDINQYIQYWNVITLKYADEGNQTRVDPHIRRGRLGVSGRLNDKILFNASFAYDGIGKDSLSTSAGIPNAEDNQTFFPRDILMTYRAHTLFNITIGYFRPRAGKESIYSSSFNISQEKGFPSYQPRFHITGRGIGRETGINIGGLVSGDNFSVLYDVGMFDPTHPSIRGNGTSWSPLLTGRTVLMLGEREMTEYLTTYFQSGYGLRKGASIGGSFAFQPETSLFRNNGFMGIDLQLNWGNLDLIGEYLWMFRESLNSLNEFDQTVDECFVAKAAYNITLKNKQLLQICAMYSGESPDSSLDPLRNLYTNSIFQRQYATGINWLLNRDKLKLGLHFSWGERTNSSSNTGDFMYINPSIQFMM